ncbi:MAG: trypsin-like peptidase domain-containing protein [Burkholderiaceae bacterium]|nr:trypsin-like peptidase domain-containing protein [Burkholderiaceae bacterium]
MSKPALAELLERATALVLAPQQQAGRLGTGSGFFIDAKHLVTNRHVIEGARDGSIMVTSRALGRLHRASIVAVTRSSNTGSDDFALLRLATGDAPGTLALGDSVSKLSPIVAAGFPGAVIRGDPSFRRLLGGDIAAAPDLNVTSGAVQSLRDSGAGVPLIVHTASVIQGNSGGPLVDECGRVVGVNTFISVDQKQSARISYSLRTSSLQRFLANQPARFIRDERACTPS